MRADSAANSFTHRPLTLVNWKDFEELFGARGAYGGCWCMFWRLTRSKFTKNQGEANRQSMETLVRSGEVPGILLYQDDRAIGWCSVAPRANFASLNRSPILKPVDDQSVWSIVCFYITKVNRGEGILDELILAAIEYVKTCGGEIIESYPTISNGKEIAPVSVYMGTPSAFLRAGFVEVKRASKRKLIMRYLI